MKLNIYLIGAFFGMLILASCGNDDDETPVPKDDSWYWGYFKGEINGKEISLENEAHTDWSVHSVKTSASPPNYDTDSIRGMMTSIKYGEDELLSITIYHLHKGIRYITKSTKTDWLYDGIQITRDTHSDKYEDKYIYYIPQKEKPFQVEITKSAACPNAIQHGSIRNVENPICEPDTGTGNSRLSTFRGRITPKGTVYTAVG